MWYALYSRVSFVLEFSHYDKRKFRALSYTLRMHQFRYLGCTNIYISANLVQNSKLRCANLGFCTYHQLFSYREYYCEGDSTCNCEKTKECLILRLETYAGISFKLKWFLKHLLFKSYCSFLET